MRSTIAALLMHGVTAFLVFLAPWLSVRSYRKLKRELADRGEPARLRFYRRAIRGQIVSIAVIALIWTLARVSLVEAGLGAPVIEWIIFILVMLLAVAISIVLFRRKPDSAFGRMFESAGALLPRSSAGRRWFSALALGAGISEELLFRGFLFYYLRRFLPGLDVAFIVLLTSAIFGLGHLYQGGRGVLLTGGLGVLFGALYAASDLLWVPMAIHASIDLRLPLILTEERIASLDAAAAGGRSA